jgi:hypothetical protein
MFGATVYPASTPFHRSALFSVFKKAQPNTPTISKQG